MDKVQKAQFLQSMRGRKTCTGFKTEHSLWRNTNEGGTVRNSWTRWTQSTSVKCIWSVEMPQPLRVSYMVRPEDHRNILDESLKKKYLSQKYIEWFDAHTFSRCKEKETGEDPADRWQLWKCCDWRLLCSL